MPRGDAVPGSKRYAGTPTVTPMCQGESFQQVEATARRKSERRVNQQCCSFPGRAPTRLWGVGFSCTWRRVFRPDGQGHFTCADFDMKSHPDDRNFSDQRDS